MFRRFGRLAALITLLALPTAARAAATSSVDGTTLTITADGDPTVIALTCSGGDVHINAADPGTGQVSCGAIVVILITGGASGDTIDTSSVTYADFSALNAAILIEGGAGNDTVIGGAIDEVIIGGPDSDMLHGGDGNDVFRHSEGDGSDAIHGDPGIDLLEVDASELDDVLNIFEDPENFGDLVLQRPETFSLQLEEIQEIEVTTLGGDDHVSVPALQDVTFTVDGGPATGSDVLVVDADCGVATQTDSLVEVTGRSPIQHSGFENIVVLDSLRVDPVSATVPAAGGGGTISLMTGDECSWALSVSGPGLEVTSAEDGIGGATIEYEMAANSGEERVAIISVNDAVGAEITQEASAGGGGPDAGPGDGDGDGGGCGCRAATRGADAAGLLLIVAALLLRRRRRSARPLERNWCER